MYNIGRVTKILVAGGSILVLFLFLYCGQFAVPSADDYAYANLTKNQDFWHSQLNSYLGWSGRYTATFLITWFGAYHLQQYWLVPWITLCLSFSSFSFLFWTLFFRLRRTRFFFVFPISFFALFISSSVAGHGVGVINEGFFWLSGAVTYQIGAGLYFLAVSCFIWLARGRYKTINLFCSSSLFLFAMGCNETLMLLSFGTVIILLWLYRKNFQVSYLLVFFIVLSCFFVVLFAPGNSVRLSTAEGHDFFSALGICVEKLVETYFYSLVNPALWLFVLVFQEMIDKMMASIEQLMPVKYFYFLLALLIYCLYFPVAWSLDSGAPDRLVSFIGFLGLLSSIFIVRALLFKIIRFVSLKKIGGLASILSVIFFPFLFESLYIAMQTVSSGPNFYASHMERNAYVQRKAAEGASTVRVTPIKRNRLLLFKDLDTPDHSIHYARYYGFESVSVEKSDSL